MNHLQIEAKYKRALTRLRRELELAPLLSSKLQVLDKIKRVEAERSEWRTSPAFWDAMP